MPDSASDGAAQETHNKKPTVGMKPKVGAPWEMSKRRLSTSSHGAPTVGFRMLHNRARLFSRVGEFETSTKP